MASTIFVENVTTLTADYMNEVNSLLWTVFNGKATAGTSGTLLRSNGTNVVNTTATYPDITTANQLLYSSATNVISGLATANNSVLITNGSGVPSFNTTLPSGLTVSGLTISSLTTDLAITDGGTGQSTATTAFNALAPTTTIGDIIYHNGTDNVRLAVGTTGQVLKVSAGAPVWGNSGITSGTPVTASGPTVDFTGIPSGVKRIVVMISGLSSSGTSVLLLRLGDSGGLETSGYAGSVSSNTNLALAANAMSAGFDLTTTWAGTSIINGILTLSLLTGTTWVVSGTLAYSSAAITTVIAGSKTLTAELDRITITATNGTDTFDAGTVNILYES